LAANASYTTAEDTSLNVATSGVLTNDSDVDGDTLNAVLVSQPAHGSLTLNSNGSFSYTPAANYSGTDSFTYKANDGQADSGIATVTITITAANDAPVAVNDSYTTAEDTTLNVAAPGVLTNDSDVDGDTLNAVLARQPAHDSQSWNSTGNFYTLPLPDALPIYSFTYKANDGQADSGIATVTITITAANDAPVAVNDSYTIAEDTTLNVAAPGVLSNDVDVDGDSLSAVLVSQPAHGTLTLKSDGSRSYTPGANYNHSDSFNSIPTRGSSDLGIATVTITITAANDAPVAVNDSYTTTEDTTLNVAAPGVLSNDGDGDGDTLNAVLVSQPAHGSLTLNSNGSFSYTPAANYNGSDSFTYKANDGQADSGIATVTITITAANNG